VGLHKTGTTFLQHHLLHHRAALHKAGVLIPQTGFDTDITGRPGALSGHQGLVRALRQDDDAIWVALQAEISKSPARTVLLSAENLSMPTVPDRAERIAQLFARLGPFAQGDVLALLRAPHDYVQAFYAEWVTSAHPGGARSLAETLVDHADHLTDMATLFAPFEAATGRPVILGDFDTLRADPGLWPAFCALAGLPGDLPQTDLPRYPTPDRDAIQLLQLVNTLVASQVRRQRLMQAYFAENAPRPSAPMPLLAPADQAELIDRFTQTSAAFCAKRGYAPDLAALRQQALDSPWRPPGAVPLETIHKLLDVGAQIAGDNPPAPSPPAPKGTKSRYSFVVRPRPWLVNLLDRVLGAERP